VPSAEYRVLKHTLLLQLKLLSQSLSRAGKFSQNQSSARKFSQKI